MESNKEYHEKLAGIIKGAHAKLRHKYRTCDGDIDTVWAEHCQDDALLSQYADAMYHLANDVWTKNPKTRIDWCRETCLKYFSDGGLLKVLSKEKRRLEFEKERAKAGSADEHNHGEGSYEHKAESTAPEIGRKSVPMFQNLPEPCSSVDDVNSVQLPFRDKIRLLDVGSCYNPFNEFVEFRAIGLDISPAVSAVLRCDFLNLKIEDEQLLKEADFNQFKANLNSPLHSLPKSTFHVVIFSLLLEYFPSTKMRWICCEKAHELLMQNGLLVIITPDSHHQNKNAPMMKSWKRAIESIGFKRHCYEKQEHLHCMAFRKVQSDLNSAGDAENPDRNPDLLYIPQDFSDDAVNRVTSQEEVGGTEVSADTEFEESLMEDFGDLCFDD